MKAIALARIDPSIITSILIAAMTLVALSSSRAVLRGVRLMLETAWLYLSNTRG